MQVLAAWVAMPVETVLLLASAGVYAVLISSYLNGTVQLLTRFRQAQPDSLYKRCAYLYLISSVAEVGYVCILTFSTDPSQQQQPYVTQLGDYCVLKIACQAELVEAGFTMFYFGCGRLNLAAVIHGNCISLFAISLLPMKRQQHIWQLVANSLQQHIAVMLLYVLQSNGSSPGRQGFFMAVNAHGQMEGSIGGGIMEHKFVEMAMQQLKAHSNPLHTSLRKQVHDKQAGKNQSGMICSGEQTIVLYPVKQTDGAFINSIIACLQANKNGLLQLSPMGLRFMDTVPSSDFYFDMQDEANWLYQEKIGYKNRLYIIGGGHCSLAFAELMGKMDFYMHLYDDRENLNTFLQNGFVHEKQLVKDYADLQKAVPAGSNHYVVLMTFGYRTDSIALRALLGKQFKYIGMLGSKKKIEKLFADYRGEGIDEHLLHAVHTPIGLQIKSQTPEEIAVSIAAEIIEVKNRFLP